MNRPQNNIIGRRSTQGVALIATSLGILTFAPHAFAQTSHATSPFIVEVASAQTASADLPASIRPVLQRAALMLQAVQARQDSAPSSARQSYQASATAFRQALSAARFSTAGGSPYSGGSLAGLPVSSTQIADDIRTLKVAMRGASSRQSAALERVVSLYATGAKEFFTGQLRDALFSTDNTSRGAIVTRGGTGSASSASLTGKTVTPRGAQKGGVIQPDGSVVSVGSAPQTQIPAGAAVPSPGNTGGVNVLDGPPTVLGNGATGVGVNTLNPPVVVAPIVTTPVVPPPVTTPPPAPPAANP